MGGKATPAPVPFPAGEWGQPPPIPLLFFLTCGAPEQHQGTLEVPETRGRPAFHVEEVRAPLSIPLGTTPDPEIFQERCLGLRWLLENTWVLSLPLSAGVIAELCEPNTSKELK